MNKWLTSTLAVISTKWVELSEFITGSWKKLIEDVLEDEEKQAIENTSTEELLDKKYILEVIERNRGLDNADSLRLALIRDKLRRTRDE